MAPADISVPPELDQEAVARLLARYNLPSVAVMDDAGRLLGRITFDAVIDVVEAETTEDLLRFGGVPAGEELAAGWRDAVRSDRAATRARTHPGPHVLRVVGKEVLVGIASSIFVTTFTDICGFLLLLGLAGWVLL